MPSDNPDLYDDAPSADSAPGATDDASAETDKGAETFIAPKSAFSRELKPGDKCDVEVVSVHEDSIEFKGCSGTDKDDENPDDNTEAPAPASGGMGDMME